MTVKELKEILKDLPDDKNVEVETAYDCYEISGEYTDYENEISFRILKIC